MDVVETVGAAQAITIHNHTLSLTKICKRTHTS